MVVSKCVETEFDRQNYAYTEEPLEYPKITITEQLVYDCLNEQLPPGEEGKVLFTYLINIKMLIF